MWECSECDVENDLDPDAEEGQILTCIECASEYEIDGLDPLKLRLLDLATEGDGETDEADWDDDA